MIVGVKRAQRQPAAQPATSAIQRIVSHYDGPVGLSKQLGNSPVYQEVQRWVRRGWAAPKHFLRLEALAKPLKLGIRDLYADIDRAKAGDH